MDIEEIVMVLAKTEVCLVSLHLTLLCPTDVAFVYQLKARPSVSKRDCHSIYCGGLDPNTQCVQGRPAADSGSRMRARLTGQDCGRETP